MIVVAGLSFKYGERGWSLLDKLSVIGAGAGLMLWALTSDPVLAYYLTTCVDAMGAIPTIQKAWARPETEDRLTWSLFLLSNIINLFAIRQWTLTIALYPVYVVMLSTTMSLVLSTETGQRQE